MLQIALISPGPFLLPCNFLDVQLMSTRFNYEKEKMVVCCFSSSLGNVLILSERNDESRADAPTYTNQPSRSCLLGKWWNGCGGRVQVVVNIAKVEMDDAAMSIFF